MGKMFGKRAWTKGFSFGLTSGVVTTMGLMIGLAVSTSSVLAVIGGILSIAFADAFSDAMGVHISEESDVKNDNRYVWEATISTFLFKFIFALTFLVPVFLFPLYQAIIVAVAWGFLLISAYSFQLARSQGKKSHSVISEHLLIAVAVVIITYYVGILIAQFFSA